MKAASAKKIKTTETYVAPEEFDFYTKLGYVIFMNKPTNFGTYRAVKIEVLNNRISTGLYDTAPTSPAKVIEPGYVNWKNVG